MSEPNDHRILADTGALAVAEDGDRVIVFDRGTGALTTVTFVLGVLAAVAVGFGAVTLIVGDAVPTVVAAAILAVGVLAAVGAILAFRAVRRRRALPLHDCRTVAVLDRKRGLFSSAGGALVGLDKVRFERRMQLNSSAPKLVAVTPGGVRVLKRGNAFDGGIGKVDEVLNGVARDR